MFTHSVGQELAPDTEGMTCHCSTTSGASGERLNGLGLQEQVLLSSVSISVQSLHRISPARWLQYMDLLHVSSVHPKPMP